MFLICEKTSTNICINQLIKQETKNQEFCSFSHHFDVSCCELSAVLLRRANLYIHSCAFISNNCKGSLWAGFKFGWQKSRNSVGAAEMKNWPSQCVLSASGRRHRCRSHRRPARRRDVTQTDTLTEILKRQIGLLTASESSSSSHKRSAARGFPTTFSSAISPYKHANTHILNAFYFTMMTHDISFLWNLQRDGKHERNDSCGAEYCVSCLCHSVFPLKSSTRGRVLALWHDTDSLEPRWTSWRLTSEIILQFALLKKHFLFIILAEKDQRCS